MNIALFSDSYIPTKSGIVTVVVQLRDKLRALGHSVTVVTVETTMEAEDNDPDTFRVSSRPLGLGTDQYAANPNLKEIRDFLIPRKIDIIHCHTEFTIGRAGHKIAKNLHIPSVCTTHTMWEEFYTFYLPMGKFIPVDMIRRYLRHFFRKFTALINVSTKARNYFKNGFMVPSIPSAVIPNAIDEDKFHGNSLTTSEIEKFRSSYGLTDKNVVLLFVGRIGEEKRIVELLQICIDVIKVNKHVFAIFVGAGPAMPVLKKMASDSNVSSNLIFTGFVEWQSVHRYYESSDIFVTASLSEMHSMTILEASILGLPIVARWDESYIDTIFDDKNGYLARTDKEMTEKILHLVEDGEKRQRFGDASREISAGFSLESHTKKTISFYNAVIDSFPLAPDEKRLREAVETDC